KKAARSCGRRSSWAAFRTKTASCDAAPTGQASADIRMAHPRVSRCERKPYARRSPRSEDRHNSLGVKVLGLRPQIPLRRLVGSADLRRNRRRKGPAKVDGNRAKCSSTRNREKHDRRPARDNQFLASARGRGGKTNTARRGGNSSPCRVCF